MADWAFRVLSLLVVGALVWYGLRAYHHRELARIETAELELEDFVKIALGAITFAWQCPHCGAPLLTAEALAAHRLESSSVCAWFIERVQQERELTEARMERAAGAREDSWPALGVDDAAAGGQ